MIKIQSILIGDTVKANKADKLMKHTGANQMLINGFTKLLKCDIELRTKEDMKAYRQEISELSGVASRFVYFNYYEKTH